MNRVGVFGLFVAVVMMAQLAQGAMSVDFEGSFESVRPASSVVRSVRAGQHQGIR